MLMSCNASLYSICSGADFVAEKSFVANRLSDSLWMMMLRGRNS